MTRYWHTPSIYACRSPDHQWHSECTVSSSSIARSRILTGFSDKEMRSIPSKPWPRVELCFIVTDMRSAAASSWWTALSTVGIIKTFHCDSRKQIITIWPHWTDDTTIIVSITEFIRVNMSLSRPPQRRWVRIMWRISYDSRIRLHSAIHCSRTWLIAL